MTNTGLQFYKEYFKNLSFENDNGKIKPKLDELKTKDFVDRLFNLPLQNISPHPCTVSRIINWFRL